ncbi:ABC transporter permease [Lachnospiraceae bacterium LCP25S3_G4]
MISWLAENKMRLLTMIGEHLVISLVALGIGALIAILLGIFLTKAKKISQFLISVTSILQTVPSLALLAIMVPILGVGKTPAIVALVIYSLLPILRNTYLGMSSVDSNLLDASKGMGMTSWQVISKVQIPLALPVIMAGVRLSAVYLVSWATIASYIGAGGLGDLIFMGLNNFNFNAIFAGTISVTIMAFMFDLILGKIEQGLTPITKRVTAVTAKGGVK